MKTFASSVFCLLLGCQGAQLLTKEKSSSQMPSSGVSTSDVAGKMFLKVLESGARIALSKMDLPVERKETQEGGKPLFPKWPAPAPFQSPADIWGANPLPGEHGLTMSYVSESEEGHKFQRVFDNPARCKVHDANGDNECQFRYGEAIPHKGLTTLTKTMEEGSTIETMITHRLMGVMSTMYGPSVEPVYFKCALCGSPCLVEQGPQLPKFLKPMPPCPVQAGTIAWAGDYTMMPAWSPQMNTVEYEQTITETTRYPDGKIALRSISTNRMGPFK